MTRASLIAPACPGPGHPKNAAAALEEGRGTAGTTPARSRPAGAPPAGTTPACAGPARWASTILAIALATAAVASPFGCGHHGPPPGGAPNGPGMQGASPGVLPPPDAIPGPFAVRQKIVAKSRHGSGGFEAVLQKQPGRLTLLGLTPYGSRAFLLDQSAADGVKFTSYIPRELPFSPDFILMDIHRVLATWLGPPPAADGTRSGVVHDEQVTERWAGGRLVSRTFAPAADPQHPTTSIDYDGAGPAGLPAKVSLSNTRFGYSLVIESVPM